MALIHEIHDGYYDTNHLVPALFPKDMTVPLLIGYVASVQCHAHSDWTAVLVDEMHGVTASSLGDGGEGEVECQRSHNRQRGCGNHTNNSGRGVLCWLEERLVKQHPGWIRPGVVWMLEGAKLALFASSTSIDEDGAEDEEDYDNTDPQIQQPCTNLPNNVHGAPLPLPDDSPSTEHARGGAKIDRMMLVGESSLVYAWTPEEASAQLSNEDFIDLMKRRCELELPDVVEVDAEVAVEKQDNGKMNGKMNQHTLGVIDIDGVMDSTSKVAEHDPSKNRFKRFKSPVSVEDVDTERMPKASIDNDAERPFESNAIAVGNGEDVLEAHADNKQKDGNICDSTEANPYTGKLASGNGDGASKPRNQVTPTPKRPLQGESTITDENETGGFCRGLASPYLLRHNSLVKNKKVSESIGNSTIESLDGLGRGNEPVTLSNGNKHVSTPMLQDSSLNRFLAAEKSSKGSNSDVASSSNQFCDASDLDSFLYLFESNEKHDDASSSDKLHPSNGADSCVQKPQLAPPHRKSHKSEGENPHRKSLPTHRRNSSLAIPRQCNIRTSVGDVKSRENASSLQPLLLGTDTGDSFDDMLDEDDEPTTTKLFQPGNSKSMNEARKNNEEPRQKKSDEHNKTSRNIFENPDSTVLGLSAATIGSGIAASFDDMLDEDDNDLSLFMREKSTATTSATAGTEGENERADRSVDHAACAGTTKTDAKLVSQIPFTGVSSIVNTTANESLSKSDSALQAGSLFGSFGAEDLEDFLGEEDDF